MWFTLALSHFLFFLRRIYKAAIVTRLGGLPYLYARVNQLARVTLPPCKQALKVGNLRKVKTRVHLATFDDG